MKKIKQISTYLQLPDREETLQRLEERDERENVLLEEQYYPTGDLESRLERTFDADNRLAAIREYASDAEQPDQEMLFEYTAAGKIALKRVVYRDGSESQHRYAYDEAERGETITIVDEEGTVEGVEYRRYDSEGRVLEERIAVEEEQEEVRREQAFDDHGMLLKRRTVQQGEEEDALVEIVAYERDEKGLVRKRTIEDEAGDILRLDLFAYDERGNTVEHQAEDHHQGWAIVDRWEFDDQDRVSSSQRTYPGGAMLQETALSYDETGLLAERETRTPQGIQVFRYRYEFFPV